MESVQWLEKGIVRMDMNRYLCFLLIVHWILDEWMIFFRFVMGGDCKMWMDIKNRKRTKNGMIIEIVDKQKRVK